MKPHSTSNKYLRILLCHSPSSPDLHRPASLPGGGQVLQAVCMCLCAYGQLYDAAGSPSILPPHIQPLRGTADRHVPAECGKWGRCPPGRGSVWPGAGAAARSRRRLHQTPSQTPNPAHSPGMAGHVALDETESALDGRVGKSWQEEDRTQSCLSITPAYSHIVRATFPVSSSEMEQMEQQRGRACRQTRFC